MKCARASCVLEPARRTTRHEDGTIEVAVDRHCWYHARVLAGQIEPAPKSLSDGLYDRATMEGIAQRELRRLGPSAR